MCTVLLADPLPQRLGLTLFRWVQLRTFLGNSHVFLTHADPFETFKYIQVANGRDFAHLDGRLASTLGTQAGDRLPGRIEGLQEGISPHSLPQVGHHLCRKLLHLHRGTYTN